MPNISRPTNFLSPFAALLVWRLDHCHTPGPLPSSLMTMKPTVQCCRSWRQLRFYGGPQQPRRSFTLQITLAVALQQMPHCLFMNARYPCANRYNPKIGPPGAVPVCPPRGPRRETRFDRLASTTRPEGDSLHTATTRPGTSTPSSTDRAYFEKVIR